MAAPPSFTLKTTSCCSRSDLRIPSTGHIQKRLKPPQRRIRVDHDGRWYRRHIAGEATFGFKVPAKFGLRQKVGNSRDDPAGKVKATASAEGERQVSGNAAQDRAEHVERRPAYWTGVGKSRRGDLGRVALRHDGVVERGNRAEEIDEPVAG